MDLTRGVIVDPSSSSPSPGVIQFGSSHHQPPLPPMPPPDVKTGEMKILGRRHRERRQTTRTPSVRDDADGDRVEPSTPGVPAKRLDVGSGASYDASMSPGMYGAAPSVTMEDATSYGRHRGSMREPRSLKAIDLSAEMAEESKPHVAVLHIPNSKVGLVIGKEGRHVSHVQHRTGTRISIARDSWDGAKRRVEIEGTPERCAEAVAMIRRMVDSTDGRGDGGIQEGEQPSSSSMMVDDAERGMDVVASLGDVEYNEHDNGVGDDTDDGQGGGTTGGGGGRSFEDHRRQGSPTATMTIPHTKVGMIIGRGGDNVKFIQQQTRARIQIQTDSETPEGAPNRMVFLRGPVEACRHAARLINDMCIGRMLIHSPQHPAAQAAPPMSPPTAEGNKPGVMPPMPYAAATASARTYPPMPMEYSMATSYPFPYFGQPYTGLYNAPYGGPQGAPAYMPPQGEAMGYWTQYPGMYVYGQPMMPSPYAMDVGKPSDTVYYDPTVMYKPEDVDADSAPRVAEPQPSSFDASGEPDTDARGPKTP